MQMFGVKDVGVRRVWTFEKKRKSEWYCAAARLGCSECA